MFDLAISVVSLTVFSIALLVVSLIRRTVRKEEKDSQKKPPPSMPALPLVGSLPFIRCKLDDVPKFFMEQAKTLGPIFQFYAGRKLTVVLNDRDSILDALHRHSEGFADRADFWTDAKLFNINVKGIIFAHYSEQFKNTHKWTLSILKEFGFGATKEMEHRIVEEAEVMLTEIQKLNGQPFYPKFHFATVTGTVMWKILFGRRSIPLIDIRESIEAANAHLSNMDTKLNTAPILRFLPKFRKMLETMNRAQVTLMKHLEVATKIALANNSESSFVKRFVETEGPDYDQENLMYVLRDLMLGSAETVATTLMWAVIELANNPKIQATLHKEIDEVIPDGRLPSFDDRTSLPYAEAVILEGMRFHTLTPLPAPRMTYKDTKACGYDIPRGTVVMQNLYATHMDSKIWTDPENFRPERFLDKDKNVIGKTLILPFGIGKRSCIGELLARQELFLLFTSLVQQFEFRPPEGMKLLAPKKICALTVSPAYFEIRMIPRKKTTNGAIV